MSNYPSKRPRQDKKGRTGMAPNESVMLNPPADPANIQKRNLKKQENSSDIDCTISTNESPSKTSLNANQVLMDNAKTASNEKKCNSKTARRRGRTKNVQDKNETKKPSNKSSGQETSQSGIKQTKRKPKTTQNNTRNKQHDDETVKKEKQKHQISTDTADVSTRVSKPQIPTDTADVSTRVSKSPQIKEVGAKSKKKETRDSKLTDFFPVRRSVRALTKDFKRQRSIQLEEAILQGCEDGLQVEDIEGKGRGVIACKPFSRGDFVVEYAGELIDLTKAKELENEYSKKDVGCYMYYFNFRDRRYCIDATAESGKLGRLLNHSKKGNCQTRVIPIKDRPYLILEASRDIKIGEELLYDYGDRSPESIAAYPWLKM